MIMPRDDKPKKTPKPLSPYAVLLSMERHLQESSGVSEDAVFEAQQFVYDAWEAETEEGELDLILKALELDPVNVDGLLTLLRHCEPGIEEEIDCLRKIVAVGEMRLGPRTFKEGAGHFWGILETRPYMRARQELAEALRWSGRLEEAVAEWEAMLKLNPNDNQGLRYSLLACYLALGRLAGARRLFKKYRGEEYFNTVFAWGRVLERFLAGELAEAGRALAGARKQNPHTQGYVKGHRRLPKHLPDSYSPGSKEEADCFAEMLREAWSKHPPALQWLAEQKDA